VKATSIVRRIDDLGRICLPKEIRQAFKIVEGDSLEIYTGDDGEIILKKYVPGCHECGEVGVELYGENVRLCRKCLECLNGAK